LQSQGCGVPCPNPVVAAFSLPNVVQNAGEPINFSNQSQNANTYIWSVNGVQFSTAANPSYIFNTEGAFTVQLQAFSSNNTLCPSAVFSMVVQVICTAKADFTVSDFEINQGETVSFTNISQNASVFNWQIGNLSVGSSLSSYQFNDLGTFKVRLTAGNGFCSTSTIRNITVIDSCRSTVYEWSYGLDSLDERGVESVTLTSGQHLIGGDGETNEFGREVIFIKTDENGVQYGSIHYGGVGDQYLIDLTLFGGNIIALIANKPDSTATSAELVWMDENLNFIRKRSFQSSGYLHLTKIYSIFSLYVIGSISNSFIGNSNMVIMSINFDGSLNWSKSYAVQNASITLNDVTSNSNNSLFAVGTIHFQDTLPQPFIVNFDKETGGYNWGKMLEMFGEGGLSSIAYNQTNFEFSIGGFEKTEFGEYITFLWNTDINMQNNFDRKLIYGNPTSNKKGAHSININGSQRNFFLTNNGELPQIGSFYNSFGANLLWLKSSLVQNLNHVTSTDFNVYVTGTKNNGIKGNIYWSNFNNINELKGCNLDELSIPQSQGSFITITDIAAESRFEIPIQTGDGQFFDYPLIATSACENTCIPSYCKKAWIKTLGFSALIEEMVKIVPAPDGTFYGGGFTRDSTYLCNFAPDGSIIWSRCLQGSTEREILTDLILDNEGMLVGVGNEVNDNIKDAFIFRYNPLLNQVLWLQKNTQYAEVLFNSITQKSNGNYIIGGRLDNGTSNTEAFLFEIDKNTGLSINNTWKKNYNTGEYDEIAQIIKDIDNHIYVLGTKSQTISKRVFLAKYNADGTEIWSKTLKNFPVLNAVGLVLDKDSIVIVFDMPIDTMTAMYFGMAKFTSDGNLLWAKRSNIFIIASPIGIYKEPIKGIINGKNNEFYVFSKEFIARINNNGSIEIKSGFATTSTTKINGIAFDNESVYFAGFDISDNNMRIARLRAQELDMADAICFLITSPLNITENIPIIAASEPNIPLTQNLNFTAIQASAKKIRPKIQSICGAYCQEYCGNGTSDDYDNLADCSDTDCFCNVCKGENARFWFFGNGAGLDFSTDPPTPITGATNALGATAVATDAGGALLFYTDGKAIYNRNHEIMDNGGGLWGTGLSSSTQILSIAPYIEVGAFWVFYSNDIDYPSNFNRGLLVAKVNMNLENGLGGVVFKNYSVENFASFTEKSFFRNNCTSETPSLITQAKSDNTIFRTYNLEYGFPFNNTFISQNLSPAPNIPSSDFTGQIKTSPNQLYFTSTLPNSGGFDVIDFETFYNPTILSLNKRILSPNLKGAFGLEYSSNGRFVYVSTHATPSQLWQFDIWKETAQEILQSGVLIAENAKKDYFGSLQMASNEKIYITEDTASNALGVIFKPNEKGLACQFDSKAQTLGTGKAGWGLPNFKNDLVSQKQYSRIIGPDSICAASGLNTYYFDPLLCNTQADVQWELTGDATITNILTNGVSISHAQPGTATLILKIKMNCDYEFNDTLHITFLDNQSPTLNLGQDKVICNGGVVKLNVGEGFASYLWNDGTGENSLTATTSGVYTVKVKDACGATQVDSVYVTIIPPFDFDLGADKTICRGETLKFTKNKIFDRWEWSPKIGIDCDTCKTVNLTPQKSTDYVVVGQNGLACISIDTISVKIDSVFSTSDTIVCANQGVFVNGNFYEQDTTLQIATLNTQGCDSIIQLEIMVWETTRVTLPQDTTLKIGDSLQINANLSGNVNYSLVWSPAEGLSCVDCDNPSFLAVKDIVYTLSASTDEGCISIDSIKITVVDSCGIKAANAFTPNNDGVNDYFALILDPCVTKIIEFSIYNRWGLQLYSIKNTIPNALNNKGWDGRYKNQDFPMDVLVWKAEVELLDRKRRVLKGDVTLIR
jgi:gliding motility-associated-like protein